MSSPTKSGGPRICSTSTPQGYLINCACNHDFTTADTMQPAECPVCQRLFEPGYAVKATVLSKISGMPIGTIIGGEPAAKPEEAISKAAARLYDAALLTQVDDKLLESEPAFFDCNSAEGAV
jgi:hypothetical protein